MAQILSDGTVIPSYMSVRDGGDNNEASGNMSSMALRAGEVREIIYPDDNRSVSKRFVEYTIEVQERDGNGPGTSMLYGGCQISNPFGGAADLLRYTHRRSAQDSDQSENGVSVGSKVVILCINGDITKAVIISGTRDTGTDQDGSGYQGRDSSEDGHNLFFEFNGAQATINKNGELQVMFRGATDPDGKLTQGGKDPAGNQIDAADAGAEGSTIIFSKDGSIKAFTKDSAQFIHLDHKNKKIDILSDQEWHVKSNKKLTFEIGDSISITGQADATLQVSSNINLKSSGVMTGAATDSTVLGTTYRADETAMNSQLSGALAALATAITATATGLLSTAPAAGAALAPAAAILTTMASAITTFESKAVTHLSKKNKSD